MRLTTSILVFGVLVSLVIFGVFKRSADSKAEFVREYVAAVKRVAPEAQVAEVGDLELRITLPSKISSSAFLGNCYAEWRLSTAEERAKVVDRYVAAISLMTPNESPAKRVLIIPTVKDRAWVKEAVDTMRQRNPDKGAEFVTDDINDDLCIVYAKDTENAIAYLTPGELRASGIPRSDLKRIATNNLRSILPDISARGGNGYYMLVAGGNYEASLILLDEIWSHSSFKVDGDIVIAIPTRDLLLVTGTRNAEGIAKIKAVVKGASELSYRLSSKLFVYRNGHFVRYE